MIHFGIFWDSNQKGLFDAQRGCSLGRCKDRIIAGGYNVYPRGIDEILFQHPKILEACSIGVPDPYRGQTVKAYVVVKPGEILTADEVIQFCRKKLAAYKAPKIVEFIDALPKIAIGKILRREIKEMNKKKQMSKLIHDKMYLENCRAHSATNEEKNTKS